MKDRWEESGTEPMDEMQQQKQSQQAQRRRLFQILAGGYLVYLAYQLITEVLAEKSFGAGQIACLVGGVVFAVVGVFVLVHNLKAEIKQSGAARKEEEEKKP